MVRLDLIEQYGFRMYIDDVHVGDICPSGDDEWAAYTLTATGGLVTPRLSTDKDIFSAIDDLESNHYAQSGEGV